MAQFPSVIDLSSLKGANGFRLDGVAAGDQAGASVAATGDIDGDGYDDLIFGAGGAGDDDRGAAYVLFGKASGFKSAIALSSLSGTSGFCIDGQAAGDSAGRSVAGAGDVNGDGLADLIIGAYQADPNGGKSGASYVIFGRESGLGSGVALSKLDGSNGFRLDGGAEDDRSGFAVSGAGDVNGDGIDDVVIGANGADRGGYSQGSSYVVFGRKSGFASVLDLSSLNRGNGFRLDGDGEFDLSGSSVASAGDVNGDGIGDLVIGAPFSNANGEDSGAAYVVIGNREGFASALDLGELNGDDGFRLLGAAPGDLSGISVAGAGDINGDGFSEIIIGSRYGDGDGTDTGAAYVIFGRAASFSSSLGLAGLNGSNGFRIDGSRLNDFAGYSVAAAGDVNGDGFADLIVGASGEDSDAFNGGSSYVVFGKASGFAASIDLAALNGSNGFRIGGVAMDDASGHSVSAAGDINGDGFADLVIGAYRADPNGDASGAAYVVFGRKPDAAVSRTGTDISQTLAGGDFADTLSALGGSDRLFGHGGNDKLSGGQGRDTMLGGAGNDLMTGDAQGDIISAGFGNDSLAGGAGSDQLGGGDGADLLVGGAGSDRIFGGGGNDSFNSGSGKDALSGGTGTDVFAFTTANWGGDTIVDFEDGTDFLRFKRFIADEIEDFAIAGNNSTSVTLLIGSSMLVLHGAAPITVDAADFQFLA